MERELDDLHRQVQGRTESLARRFDRVLRLLEAWGYLDGWALTAAREVLARTYHEADLLVAEAMTTGLLDDLDAPSLAALVSCLTYEHRSRDRPPHPGSRRPPSRTRFVEIGASPTTWRPTRRRPACPRPGRPMPASCTSPTRGRPATGLATVLEDEELSGGDFVRNVKQLIDLLRGIGDVAPAPATAARARQAADALHRGVVTATSRSRSSTAGGPGSTDDDPKGEPWGRPGPLPAHGVVVRSDAEARARSSRRHAARRTDPAARASSAATCAGRSAAPVTRPACAPSRPCRSPSTSARSSSTDASTGSSRTWSPAGAGGAAGSSRR